MAPLILPPIKSTKRNGKSPEMIHSRHPTPGSRPTTTMDTRGAIMPGYTGTNHSSTVLDRECILQGSIPSTNMQTKELGNDFQSEQQMLGKHKEHELHSHHRCRLLRSFEEQTKLIL